MSWWPWALAAWAVLAAVGVWAFVHNHERDDR